MKRQMEEQELLRRIAELPREIRPQNDPWAAISARIDQPRSRHFVNWPSRGWMMQAAAASVVVALVLGLLLGPRFERTPQSGSNSAEVVDDRLAGQTFYPRPETLAASEAEYQAAFREFIAVGEARSSLSPRTIETIETSWAEMRAAEAALAAALAANPDDRFLNGRMLELRARQLGFLRELAWLDQSNRRLTT